MDPSTIILELTTSDETSIIALKHPHNEAFIVSSDPSVSSAPRHKRGVTPQVEKEQISAVLRTDQYPFDPMLGYIFGSDEDKCDFLLGSQSQGVSGQQFRIDYNWEGMTLVLTNLSNNGTRWVDSEVDNYERIMTSRAILAAEKYRVLVGVIDLSLHVPHRSEEEQRAYDINMQTLRHEVEQAVPTIAGLNVKHKNTVTPNIVGRKRRFIMRKVLGSGTSGIVREAFDYETGDRFAAKEYDFGDRPNKALRAMLNEVKILQKLDHKHVIKYVDIFHDPEPILIMEVGINSLEALRITNVNECVTLLKHVLSGLAYLHQQNIMHRDIKPANILLTKEEPVEWKLADFGLSKVAKLTSTFCGSSQYLAPELNGLAHSVYTAAVDVWATGVIGEEYTCGLPPKEWVKRRETFKQDAWCQSVSERSQNSLLAPYLNAMLDMVPAKRPSASEMVFRLEKGIADSEQSTSSEIVGPASSIRSQKRKSSLD